MLFQSGGFLLSLLLPALILFYFAARMAGKSAAIFILIAASAIFYASWRPLHLGILIVWLILTYLLGNHIRSHRQTRRGQLCLAAAISLNVGVLLFYKYWNFFIISTVPGGNTSFLLFHLAVPLGLSFITFQKIAYLIDAYHNRIGQQTFPEFVLFVMFFPQLVAGPIVHQNEVVPQFRSDRFGQWDGDRFVGGVSIFILGAAKKILLADGFAPFVDSVFQRLDAATPVFAPDAWIALLGFAFQIYFDFSGYSDMAIGLGLMFGIKFPENFRAPYRAASLIEFWRRWHITLSRFLRDYVYIPMGGNRAGTLRTSVALATTMLIGGIWHGPSWTFVAWGCWHGLFLVINHRWRGSGRELPSSLGWFLTFSVVLFGWLLFRSGNFATYSRAISALIHGSSAAVGFSGELTAWLKSCVPASNVREFADLFFYLGFRQEIGGLGIEWRNLLCSRQALLLLRLAAAIGVLRFGTLSTRWAYDLETGRTCFDARKALLLGLLGFLCVLASFAETASTFLYFKF